MNRQNYSRPFRAFQAGVVGADRFIESLIGIDAHLIFYVAAPLRVDVIAIARRIDLHVLCAFAHQRADLGFHDRHDILKKFGIGRIDFVADAFLKVNRRKLISRGQCDFYVTRAVLLDEGKFVRGQTPLLFDFAYDRAGHHRRTGRWAATGLPGARNGNAFIDSFHGLVEVTHEVVAAQLAVSENPETKVLLPFDYSQNMFVFEGPQLLVRNMGAARL